MFVVFVVIKGSSYALRTAYLLFSPNVIQAKVAEINLPEATDPVVLRGFSVAQSYGESRQPFVLLVASAVETSYMSLHSRSSYRARTFS